MDGTVGSLNTKLQRFLLAYRTTPQTTTGKTPAELLNNRKLKTNLDLIKHPNNDVREHVERKQQTQKEYHDQHAKSRDLDVGENVFVKNFYGCPKWLYGQVVCKTGPVSYTVKCPEGNIGRRHIDQHRSRHCHIPVEETLSEHSEEMLEPVGSPDTSVTNSHQQGDITVSMCLYHRVISAFLSLTPK
ncbi:uncharacterized protein [Argopecten irradians]|uniref:uncharacterized protein n=1 Tax=Argopecten irradians TaxID=31199 RepID=UPI00371D466B